MKTKPYEPLATGLITWYALYQSIHVLVNTRGLWILISGRALDFPAPPPNGGWSADVVHLMVAIGVLDLVNAVAALVFVWGYFTKKDWHFWLGTLTTTVSVYAFGLYIYWTFASGAWTADNLPIYLVVNGGFLPISALWLVIASWGSKGFQSGSWMEK